MKRYIYTLFLLSIYYVGFSQDTTSFTPEQLKADFEFLRKQIETYNPALGVFHPEEELQNAFDSLNSKLNKDMSIMEFYPYLVKLSAAQREGHAWVGEATDTTNLIYHGFFNGAFKFFPISTKLIEGKLYAWGSLCEDSTLQKGDEIVEINGKPISQIVETIEQFIITDGDIEAYKTYRAGRAFASLYYWFVAQPDTFSLRYISAVAQSEEEIKIKAITRQEMIEWRDKYYGKSKELKYSISDVYELEIDSSVAILTLKNFTKEQMSKYKIKPQKLYKDLFKEVGKKDVKHLIIDVRDNTGGRKEYVWEAIPFLAKSMKQGIVYSSISWKGGRKNYEFTKPHKKWAFQGEIYVLTNNKTFSNGSVMAVYAKEFGDAIVIGQETGTRYEGFAAGSRQVVTLPNTKIRCAIPRYLWRFDLPTGKMTIKNRGVIPDYPIHYSLQDLIDKKDKEMAKVKELIDGL